MNAAPQPHTLAPTARSHGVVGLEVLAVALAIHAALGARVLDCNLEPEQGGDAHAKPRAAPDAQPAPCLSGRAREQEGQEESECRAIGRERGGSRVQRSVRVPSPQRATRTRTSITAGVRRVTVVVASKAKRWSVAVVGTVTASSEVQSSKAPHPISVTAAGMFTVRSAEQPSKAFSPIAVTVAGMATSRSAEQPLKASGSITVTDDGIAMERSEEQ